MHFVAFAKNTNCLEIMCKTNISKDQRWKAVYELSWDEDGMWNLIVQLGWWYTSDRLALSKSNICQNHMILKKQSASYYYELSHLVDMCAS